MKRRPGKIEWVLALTLVLCCLYSAVYAQSGAEQNIRQNTVRLHILANSDSERDQALKLAVRDELLARSDEWFDGAASKEQALQALRQKLPQIEQIAGEVLRQNGCDLPVQAKIVEMDFAAKEYEDTATLPAGTYDALRVIIGDGEGHNWWCVMFPPLCVPTASEQTTLTVYGEDGAKEVAPGGTIQVKFKLAEWWQKLTGQEER
ncbi:stage II sporulation protein R [Anaerotruncus sp. 2789STDY5834896]|uniref:Stage II sporulation protein R n=1 Tax=uncultured Anaerotruncus sp. TaxID=905011 RepID=A0A1C6HRB6_9FIRM|nr:stage II sporulation protein R [uncultured Anaerotruncus sp.]